jgi:hypothetical protein
VAAEAFIKVRTAERGRLFALVVVVVVVVVLVGFWR